MPDITMCVGLNCPLKETCYRFKAKPNNWQPYFVHTPFVVTKAEDVETHTCEYKIEVKDGV
jgi:hypothetical protein